MFQITNYIKKLCIEKKRRVNLLTTNKKIKTDETGEDFYM